MTTNSKVVVIGGANIDTKWRAHHKIYEGSSSSGEKTEHFGGVARNIAEGLARLGVTCRFISRVGNDEQGRAVIRHLASLSVDIECVGYSECYPTANYCAFFHPQGDVYTALIDLQIYEECTDKFFLPLLPKIASSKVVVLDTDLPQATLLYLAQGLEQELWVSLTCVPAVQKIKPILRHITVLFLNHQEFHALCPESLASDEQFLWLHDQGVGTIVVTQGERGIVVSEHRNVLHLPAIPTTVIDVTGAGDALVAGSLAAHLCGQPLADSLAIGIQAARLTVETTESVSPYLSQLLPQ